MKYLLLLLLLPLALSVPAQTGWQQQTDYTLDVSLNDKEKTLDGFATIVYTNNSPDTLRYIWFHLWPNAYKNDRTALSDQLLENGSTAFYFATPAQRGYINRLQFQVDGLTASTEDHPQHIDITKLLLPKPVRPGGRITITTPFHVKLPFAFSRSGYVGESFQLTQWYPKPAVYDRQGWHPMPYLEQGEFYSEFGSFDVRITVPQHYVVAATGQLQNEEERLWLNGKKPAITAGSAPVSPRKRNTRPGQRKKITAVVQAPLGGRVKTLHFKQSGVHDFAWFADKRFAVSSDTLQLPSGKMVEVSAFFIPTEGSAWHKAVAMAKSALRFYSAAVGDYPYASFSVVQGQQAAAGGMEYPGITLLSGIADEQDLDAVIAHEAGHNWFYGALASNERDHPWLDEGLNSFYERQYRRQKYGVQESSAEIDFQARVTRKTDQPITTAAAQLSNTNYGLVAYHKTAEWLALLEEQIGRERFQQLMQAYYRTWAGKHPQPADFKSLVLQHGGTDSLLRLLDTTGVLPHNRLTGTALVFPLKKNGIRQYLLRPKKNAVLVLPAVGFNSYDKLMAGAIVSNYGSPAMRLNYLAIPLYATGSRSLSGLAKINYAWSSRGVFRRADVFVNAASFTINRFTTDEGKNYRMRFAKLVPGFRLTLNQASPRSTAQRYLQWKTFLIREQRLRISVDSIITPTDTTLAFRYSTPAQNRYLNQLQLVFRDSRALYPYDVNLQVEQARNFVRAAFTAHYFFNYARGGGLALRFFAGKFQYINTPTVQERFATDRFHLNMTGPNGFEDYTYSDYFVGRNQFEGLASQQIMLRDGGFKVRTDLLANKVGKTDNWLMAANLVTTVPQHLNPLAVLPVKIPLRLFADVGTYAEAWDRAADTDRFLFDAGVQLSFFKETVNVYVPLLYSQVYRTYIKSTIPDNRLLRTISFTINFFNPDVKKLHDRFLF